MEVGSSFMSVHLKPGTFPQVKKKLVFGEVHEDLYHPLNSFSAESSLSLRAKKDSVVPSTMLILIILALNLRCARYIPQCLRRGARKMPRSAYNCRLFHGW